MEAEDIRYDTIWTVTPVCYGPFYIDVAASCGVKDQNFNLFRRFTKKAISHNLFK